MKYCIDDILYQVFYSHIRKLIISGIGKSRKGVLHYNFRYFDITVNGQVVESEGCERVDVFDKIDFVKDRREVPDAFAAETKERANILMNRIETESIGWVSACKDDGK